MALVLDTYAWIEYFKGSKAGRKIRRKIEGQRNITPTVVLAEMNKRYTDMERTDFYERLTFIHSRSLILPLDERTAISAGHIRSKIGVKDMGLVDCVLLAVARHYNVKVLTGDGHFKDIAEADYFGE